MMRGFLAAIFGIAAASQPVLGHGLPDQRIVDAVSDLSQRDAVAIAAARRGLREGPGTGMFDELPADMRSFAIIAASLEASGRLVSLDWKETQDEAAAQLTALFARAGVRDVDVSARIAQLVAQDAGSGVGIAYVAFREVAEAQGLRIVGLNADSDMFHFALTSRAHAERWSGVRLGPNQYVEDSDWQFADALEAAGITPRSTAHPAQSPRPAPPPR